MSTDLPLASLVAGPPLSRRARRRLDTRARILRAAWKLFEQQGYFATTIEQITEAADVGKGTFFNYFPSKEHVLAGFSEMQLGKVRAALAAFQQEPRPVPEVLEQLLPELAEEPGRSPALVRSLLVANLSSEAVRRMMRRNLDRAGRLLAQFIAAGQRRGEIRRDRTPAALARDIQQIYFGTLFLWAIHPSVNLAAQLRKIFRSLLAAFVMQKKKRVVRG